LMGVHGFFVNVLQPHIREQNKIRSIRKE